MSPMPLAAVLHHPADRCGPWFRCRSRMPVIDRIDSWRRGAVALWLDANGVAVESVNENRGDRPWVPHPLSKREREAAAVIEKTPARNGPTN